MPEVSVQPNKNVFEKKVDNTVKKTGLIGAGIAGIGTAIKSIKDFKNLKPLAEDAFYNSNKKLLKNIDPEGFKNSYKEYLTGFEQGLKDIKKAIPLHVLKRTAIGLAVGAAIGFIVKKVKDGKAQKTAE